MKQLKTGVIKNVTITTLVEDYAGCATLFLAQHGLCFLIEFETEVGKRAILFDVGCSIQPILHNLRLLKIDLEEVSSIVLSHTHWDHTGGLIEMLGHLDRETSVIAHPEILRQTAKIPPVPMDSGGLLDSWRRAPTPMYNGLYGRLGSRAHLIIEEHGGKLFLIREPFPLLDGVLSTGEIRDKVDFERELTHQSARMVVNGEIQPDPLLDEIGLILNLEDGLVIVTGCGHPGIASIITQARAITGRNEIKALIGGFHLIGATEKRIERSIRFLKEEGVQKVVTGHCTGLEAEASLLKAYGNRFEKLYSGKIINL